MNRRRRVLRNHQRNASRVAPRVDDAAGVREGTSTPIDPWPVAAGLETSVADCWERGWQPADLDRVVRKEATADALRILRGAIASEGRTRAELGRRVAAHWMAQVDQLDANAWWAEGACFVEELDLPVDRVAAAATALRRLLDRLPALPRLVPPPSRWHLGMDRDPAGSVRTGGPVPDDLLGRIRSLLAKAESTTFDAEAEAFTTKAQELMTRHRIDRAMLGDPTETGTGPGGRRIAVDNPYVEAKAALLGIVAEANGATAVWTKAFGFATVVGFPTDVDVVEELFTSLLVQATAAMQREGGKVDAAGRSRTTRFRRSFLVAYTARIGERLREAADASVRAAEGEYAGDVLPVLAARDDQVRHATAEVFPEIGTFRPSATDAEGWRAGTAHADRADLSSGPRLRE